MEKNLGIMVILLMVVNVINADKTLYAQSFANGLDRLLTIVEKNDLPMSGIVLEGWLPMEQWGRSVLHEQLGIADAANDVTLSEATHLKIDEQSDQVVVQLISTDKDEALQYYHQLQQIAHLAAKDAPIGATVLCTIDEALDKNACCYLTYDLLEGLPAHLVSIIEENQMMSYAYHIQGIMPSMAVGSDDINLNIAYCVKDEQTMLYLGTPIIFQQY